MPGLFGVVERTAHDAVGTHLGQVLRADSSLRSESLVASDHHWAVGRTHLGALQPEPQLVAGHGVHVLFHGDALGDDISARSRAVPTTARLREAYSNQGLEALGRWRGRSEEHTSELQSH